MYPYVLSVAEGRVLLGSESPLAVDVAAWSQRLDRPTSGTISAARARSGCAPIREGRVEPARRPRSPDLNTDLHPRDEFNAPLGGSGHANDGRKIRIE